MTQHLRPEEFVDALDGVFEPAQRDHLQSCDECRTELEALQVTRLEAINVPTSEPSPLFWEHFSARVEGATRDLDASPRRWWQIDWRPIGAVATAAGALALFLTVRPAPVVPAEIASLPAIEDDGSWEIMVGIVSQASWEDVREAVAPAVGTADAMIDELNAAQREELVRLLKKEIGEP
jgi:hypothetical protein